VSAASVETSRPKRSSFRDDLLGARRRDASVVFGLIVLGAALRFWRIGHQSYWYDESVTLELVRQPFTMMFAHVQTVEGTPPLYYCVAWVWTRIFGFGEAGLRSLSAVAGLCVIPAVYGTASELISRRAGLIAAALAACNPMLIWYSQEARAYSLMVAMASLSLLAFVHLLSSRPTGRWFVAWAVAASLTLATHYYGLVAVVPEALWLLWAHRRDLRMWSAICLVGAVGLALLPLALRQRHNASWIAELPLGHRLEQVPSQFLLGTGAPGRTWLIIASLAGLIIAAGGLALTAAPRERSRALIAGALAVAGLVLSLLLIPAGADYVLPRNLIALVVALIVLVAGGLGARRTRMLGWAGAGLLCAVGVIVTVAVAVDWKLQRPDWRGVAKAVVSTPQPGARAVLVEDSDSPIPLGDYLPGLHVLRFRSPPVTQLSVVAAVRGATPGICWWPSCHVSLAALDTSLQIPGFRRVGPVRHIEQFAIYQMRARTSTRLTRAAIHRALRGSPLTGYGLFVQPPG
jgi:uncharacterized membrane protein